MKKLDDYIHIVENVISDSLCNEIINEYNDPNEYETTTIKGDIVDIDMRKVTAISLSSPQVLNKNFKTRKMIDDAVFKASSNAIHEYHKKYSISVERDTGYQLLKYEVGDFYKEHIDSYTQDPRSISCSFALNDDFEGGNFGFFNKEKLIKVPKGSALMFPSNFMYPHEITPVTSGTRYSIITWFV